ncbi:MAG: NAD(P)-dependent oxidoreductase, partial [Polyangiaceae bacterium]
MDPLYPLFLLLGGRAVVVLGAGPVAERKIEELIGVGAKVRVVAPEATDRVRALAAGSAIAWEKRAFAASDLDSVWLAVSATGNAEVQRRIFDEA